MKALHSFLVVSYETLQGLIFSLPRYPLFNYFKKKFLELNGAKIGRRTIFYPGVFIFPGRNLLVGDDVNFAKGVIVGTPGGVTIGDRVLLGFGCQIMSGNHVVPKDRGRIFDSGFDRKPVLIERDAWVGAYSVIVAGVTIGEGAVVAAGSVVTKNVEPYSVVGGVPAKLIRMRD
jgi:acetyltransferase-like isoleucine patch superfamily enzyme